MNYFRCLFCITLSFATAALNAQTIVIAHGKGEYFPYEYVENGQLKGIHADLILATAKQLKLDVEFRAMPWKRAIKALQTGQVSALSYLSKTKARSQFALFLPNNVLSTIESYSVILKANANKIRFDGRLQSLDSYRFAVGAGFIYGEPFDSADHLLKVPLSDPPRKKLIQMLLGRVDIVVGSRANYQRLIDLPDSTITMLPTPIAFNKVYLAWHNNDENAHLAQRFATTMADFRQSESFKQKLEWYQSVKFKHQPVNNDVHP